MTSGIRMGPALLAVCGVLAFSFAHRSAAQETKSQETRETITIGDVDRRYIVHLPKGYDEQQHYPVVVLLHGGDQEAEDMERLTHFNELADKNGIVAVYPSALHGRWNFGAVEPVRAYRQGPYGRRWGYPRYPGPPPQQQGERRRPERAEDIDFFSSMLDKMVKKYSIDTTRIYVTGLSEGGFMAMKAGCGLTDRVAAIATVGAAMPKSMVCVPTRPLPVIMINGTSDPVVRYDGGVGKNGHVPTISVEDTAKQFAKLNRCVEKPSHSKLPEREKGGMETKVDTYDGCHENAEVTLYSVKGGGNTWPGGEQYEAENAIGKTSHDLVADEVIWNFLVTKKIAGQSAEQKSGGEQK